MEEKINISSNAVGVLAFVLMFFGFVEGVLLLLGFSVLVKKDPWLNRQVLQALYLRILYLGLILIVDWLFKGLLFILDIADAYRAIEDVLSIQGFINGLLYIGLFVLAFMGISKILKGQDANIPLVNNFTARTMGDYVAPKENIVMTEEEILKEEIPKDTWTCSCGAENSGKFCMTCGKAKDQ